VRTSLEKEAITVASALGKIESEFLTLKSPREEIPLRL
jgi:hypothetical protein